MFVSARKCALLLVLIVMTGNIAFSQKIQELVERFKQDEDFAGASWGFSVVDVKTGQKVAEFQSDLSLIPASTLKVITTGAALKILGKDFSYHTQIAYEGQLDTTSGLLNGNLYIIGSGDPSLESEVYRKKDDSSLVSIWAKEIEELGIQKITGRVIADESGYDSNRVPSTWIWGDMGNYYGAGSGGLNYKDNKYSLYFKSGPSKGNPTKIVRIEPEIPGLEISNHVTTGGYSDNAYIFGAPYEHSRSVSGTIPANKSMFEVEGSTPDPGLLCAIEFTRALRSSGIEINKEATTIRILKDKNEQPSDNELKTLFSHTSAKMETLVSETNLHSNNLYAESILKTIAFIKHKYGANRLGIWEIENVLQSNGINTKKMHLADGCGLSRYNLMSSSQMTSVLKMFAADSLVFETLYESLPVAGKSGSLGSLCRGTSAENNLRAKSGYMARVRSYAGFVHDQSDRLLCFSMMVNNYHCTARQMKANLEQLMIAIANLKEQQ